MPAAVPARLCLSQAQKFPSQRRRGATCASSFFSHFGLRRPQLARYGANDDDIEFLATQKRHFIIPFLRKFSGVIEVADCDKTAMLARILPCALRRRFMHFRARRGYS